MNSVNIKDIDLNNSFFHFTTRDNIEQINQEGLKAQIGDASKMKTEEKARVYMSKGGKGILGIKNSFIHEFKKLRICDIPLEYRKYFEIKNFSSEEIVQENDVFVAMEKRFKDEVYLKVNAVNGEDFIPEDFIPEDFLPEELTNEINSSNNIRDIKGKTNHDIVPDKLSIITTDKGDSTLDVLEYLYNRLMENAKKNGKEDSVKWALSDLDGLFTYIKQREKNNDSFRNVEEKIANQLGCSIEELQQQYDRQIITDKTNKDGEQLFMFRKLTSKEIVSGTYSNTARYMIYTQDGEQAGYIDAIVSNRKEANEAEIQYASNEKFSNKGNMTISLEEVLKDVFIDKSFDGLQIKPFFPKTEMKKVFLAINEDNYASQAVAKKSGFVKNGECYEITGDEFIRKLSDEKQQETLFDEQQIGKTTINVDKKDKDMAQSQIEKIKSEGKKLLESVDCKKGITLNSQIVDLLSILDKDISIEAQNAQITEYIESLRQMQTEYYEAKEKGTAEQYRFIIDKVVDSINEIPADRIDEIKQLYLASIADSSLYDPNQMEHKLIESGFDDKINELMMKQTSNMDFEAKEGILDLTPEKVRNFYSHMFNGDVPTYDRMTMDDAGKYALYVCKDGETYADERLDKMVSFAEKHNMKSKVNTFMFYADFSKTLEDVWLKQASDKGLDDEEKHQLVKEKMKDSLMGYVSHLAQNYGDRIENVDIFNELIYDPDMIEKIEIFGEERGYHPRTEGWQKYLDLEDLCEMALTARKLMPEATFTYNDMNWVNPEKRQEIIKIVKEIQRIENRYRQEGKLGKDEKGLIDIIGFEAHLTTGDKTQDIEKAFENVEREIGLPIAITELDVARVGDDPLSREEITKQNRIIEKFTQLVQEGRIQELTVWSQSDEMSFMNDKCKRMVYASVILDENCNEKEYDPRGIEQNIGEKDKTEQEEYVITPNQIGKKSIYSHIGKKDMAKSVVDRKVEERTHPQELDSHNHNGSQ